MDPLLIGLIGFIVFIVIIFLLSGIRVLKEWERMPVLRLGRYIGLKGPGIVYLVPIIDRAPLKIQPDSTPSSSEQNQP